MGIPSPYSRIIPLSWKRVGKNVQTYIIVVPNLPNQTWTVRNVSALSEQINRGNIMTLETGLFFTNHLQKELLVNIFVWRFRASQKKVQLSNGKLTQHHHILNLTTNHNLSKNESRVYRGFHPYHCYPCHPCPFVNFRWSDIAMTNPTVGFMMDLCIYFPSW